MVALESRYYTAAWLQENYPGNFEILYKACYRRMYVSARHMLSCDSLVEDVVQEVFTMLWDRGRKLDGRILLEPYLLGTLRNHCINYFRSLSIQARYKLHLSVMESLVMSPEAPGEPDLQSKVRSLLAELPEMQRKVIELSMIEGMRYKDIAALLKIAEGTVHTHIKRAYRHIKKRYDTLIALALFLLLSE